MQNTVSGDTSSTKCDIGFIGLGVMGKNLTLNLADNGYRIACFDLDQSKVDAIIEQDELERDREFVLKKLNFTAEEFGEYMQHPGVSHYHYKSDEKIYQFLAYIRDRIYAQEKPMNAYNKLKETLTPETYEVRQAESDRIRSELE